MVPDAAAIDAQHCYSNYCCLADATRIMIFNKQDDYDVCMIILIQDRLTTRSVSLSCKPHYSLEQTQEKDEKRKFISSDEIISSTILLRSFNSKQSKVFEKDNKMARKDKMMNGHTCFGLGSLKVNCLFRCC